MLLRKLLALALLLLAALPASAQTLDGNCEIRFYGDSTLHAFDGTGACEPFAVTLAVDEAGQRRIAPATITVRVAGLDTDNGGRDKKMRKMFDSENYPLIVGHFVQLDPDKLLAAWQASPGGELDFDLQIRDVTHPVNAEVRNLEITPEGATFTLAFPLSLASYRLDPPGVLGIIRVADTVKVEVDVVFAGAVAPEGGKD